MLTARWRGAALERAQRSGDILFVAGKAKPDVKQAAPGNYRTRRFVYRSVVKPEPVCGCSVPSQNPERETVSTNFRTAYSRALTPRCQCRCDEMSQVARKVLP